MTSNIILFISVYNILIYIILVLLNHQDLGPWWKDVWNFDLIWMDQLVCVLVSQPPELFWSIMIYHQWGGGLRVTPGDRICCLEGSARPWGKRLPLPLRNLLRTALTVTLGGLENRWSRTSFQVIEPLSFFTCPYFEQRLDGGLWMLGTRVRWCEQVQQEKRPAMTTVVKDLEVITRATRLKSRTNTVWALTAELQSAEAFTFLACINICI